MRDGTRHSAAPQLKALLLIRGSLRGRPRPFLGGGCIQEAGRMEIEGVITLGAHDVRSFSGLTSKIPPLGSASNFDADVKKTTARHQ